jgi:hypothetical protein
MIGRVRVGVEIDQVLLNLLKSRTRARQSQRRMTVTVTTMPTTTTQSRQLSQDEEQASMSFVVWCVSLGLEDVNRSQSKYETAQLARELAFPLRLVASSESPRWTERIRRSCQTGHPNLTRTASGNSRSKKVSNVNVV